MCIFPSIICCSCSSVSIIHVLFPNMYICTYVWSYIAKNGFLYDSNLKSFCLSWHTYAYPYTRLLKGTSLWIFCLTSSYSSKINSFKIYLETPTIDSGCVALWCMLVIAIQKQCPIASWGYCAMRRGQIQISTFLACKCLLILICL